jgi:hypothetical protein
VTILQTPPTWRARSLYLYPPGTGWPSYTPGHWVFCETSRFPHFIFSRLKNGNDVSLTRQPLFTSRKIPDTHFCWMLSRPQGLSAAGGKLRNQTTSGIEPATPTCLVPQATALPPPRYVTGLYFIVQECTMSTKNNRTLNLNLPRSRLEQELWGRGRERGFVLRDRVSSFEVPHAVPEWPSGKSIAYNQN